MKDLITYIVSGITGKDDIRIDEVEENNLVNFTVNAPEESIGMLIGKQGRTIKMIRNLLRVRATLEKKGVSVSIAENENSPKS